MNRREFLKIPCALALCGAGRRASAGLADEEAAYRREAGWWSKAPDGRVLCELCPLRCLVAEGKLGACQVRAHQNGRLETRVFGRIVTLNNDPIEKKPLFHFLPGTEVLSMSTGGCNFACQFCQNWEISQSPPEKLPARFGYVSPERLVDLARSRGSRSIAFTYAEPVVMAEYALEVSRLGRAAGLPGVMVSNGYIEQKPLDDLLGVLGAYKVDFKAYDDKFYRELCHGRLEPVLAAMKRIHARGVWLEMVHLTIPGQNDSREQVKRLCGWVLDNLGPDVPLHFTRFHPTYLLTNLPPTPPDTLELAWLTAKQAGLHYPYIGNLPGHPGENTHCHRCGQLLINRSGFAIRANNLKDGHCPKCAEKIPGVWTWPV